MEFKSESRYLDSKMQSTFNAKIKGKRNTFCQVFGGKSHKKMTTKEDEKEK